MIQDSFTFIADAELGAQYFKPTASFIAKCSGLGEPDSSGVFRPRFATDIEPDFLDATIRYVYLRCRGSSVRTLFISSSSPYMSARTFKIRVDAQDVNTLQEFSFYLDNNTNQAPAENNDGFGEYVYNNDECTIRFTLSVEI